MKLWHSLAVALIVLASTALAAPRDKTIPDPLITPGVVGMMSKDEICARKWGRDARHVPPAMKRDVKAAYADTKCRPDKHGRLVEIDHSCSRELGGLDDPQNLWKQCYAGPWNAVMKDRLENRLHKRLCADEITLEQAQWDVCLSGDWRKAYVREFGEPK